MNNERRKVNWNDAAHNAATGYAAIVLGIFVFLISLGAVTAIVRLIAGLSAGV